MMCLYQSIIRSRLEYLSPLWHPSKQEDIKCVESVQRLLTSKITGLSELSYHDRLKKLGLMSLQRRRERFIIITVWKIINEVNPNDFDFKISKSGRRGLQIKVPPLRSDSTLHAQSCYEASFAVVGPKLWNTVPRDINIITNKTTFKTALTRYLSQIPDLPPVDGYASRNSLLDLNRLDLQGGRTPDVGRCDDLHL
jgi:hypothetical protein